MNPSVLPQVTILLCLSVMVPVSIAFIRTELLRSGMHDTVLAQHLIVGLALWVVVDGAVAFLRLASHLSLDEAAHIFMPLFIVKFLACHFSTSSNLRHITLFDTLQKPPSQKKACSPVGTLVLNVAS